MTSTFRIEMGSNRCSIVDEVNELLRGGPMEWLSLLYHITLDARFSSPRIVFCAQH